MDRKTTSELLRFLHGELSDAAGEELRARLGRDPVLREELEALERQWRDLDLPEPVPAPPGFAARVVAQARKQEEGLAPAWWSHTLAGKAATALLLAGGIALGAFLASPSEAEDWSDYLAAEPSMAESYLLAMEETDRESGQENGS